MKRIKDIILTHIVKLLYKKVDGIVFVDDAGNIVEPDEQGTEILEMTPELKQRIEANYRKNL